MPIKCFNLSSMFSSSIHVISQFNRQLIAKITHKLEKLLRKTTHFKPISVYLPGTGATVILEAVPPGRGPTIALRWAEACDRPKCG